MNVATWSETQQHDQWCWCEECDHQRNCDADAFDALSVARGSA